MKYNIFLDDFRMPVDAFNYTKDTDFLKLDWIIVRSYDEFVNKIIEVGFQNCSIISLDHDLSDSDGHYGHTSGEIPYDDFKEKTGYHCAQWLIDYCLDNNQKLPICKVHSMNPVGKKNIIELLNNFLKHHGGI